MKRLMIGLILILLFASGCSNESDIENCKAIARADYLLDNPECSSSTILNLLSTDCYCFEYKCKEYSCSSKRYNEIDFNIKED